MFAHVYKILISEQWESFQTDGTFTGAPIDITDGYIHLSTAEQASETLNLHFNAYDSLALIELDASKMTGRLKYEPSRGGQLFPHYFGDLNLDWVTQSWTLTRDGSGEFDLPTLDIRKLP